MTAWSEAKVSAFRDGFYEFLNHVLISSKDGRVRLGENLYRAQHMFYDMVFEGLQQDIHEFLVLKSRQLGISTGTRALDLFWLGMHEGLRGSLVFDSAFNTAAARHEITETLRNLPARLHFPKIRSDSRDALILENDSWLLFRQAGTKNSRTGGGLGRSLGLNLSHGSEVSSWASEEGVKSYQQSLSETHEDRLYVWESTGRGFNLWHQMWRDARDDPYTKRCLFLGWWSKDNQEIVRTDVRFGVYGQEPPNKREAERITTVHNDYGWQITPEQLAWIRWKTDPSRELDDDDPEDTITAQEQAWCVSANTRVGTSAGILRASDVIAGVDGSCGPVIRAGQTSVATVWRAVTALGYELEGSNTHPLVCDNDELVPLIDSKGTVIKLQPPRFAECVYVHKWDNGIIRNEVTVTPDFARLVGIFMGDGAAIKGGQHQYAISICCDTKDQDFIVECQRLLEETFAHKTNLSVNDPNGTGGWTTVRLSTRRAVETFAALGLLRNDTVKTMRKVHVPEFIWRSPKHVVAEFLAGLFETDGFNAYDTCRCILFSKYPGFMRDVQILLLGFGITSRRRIVIKKNGEHEYLGCELQLRAREAALFNEVIGFISARKRARSMPLKENTKAKPITFCDEVVEVEDTERVEPVYNLTIDGTHWYDANGILTHNCEEDSFQQIGSAFFMSDKLSAASARLADDIKPQTFKFWPGLDFVTCDMQPAKTRREAEFRMWEEPVADSVYIVAADPAFGHDEKNNNSAAQILRCYADRIDQVGEYASATIQPHHFAWLLWTLIGYYGSTKTNCRVYFIIEINGPGEEVWRQFQATEQIVRNGYLRTAAREKGIADIFQNAQKYIYTRSDSMNAGQSWQFKTHEQNKVQIMEACRNYFHNGAFLVRSMEMIEEMRTITRDGDTIGAEHFNRDDRTFAAALGIRAWDERARRPMIAGNRTKAAERAKLSLTIEDQWTIFHRQKLTDFFAVKERARAQMRLADTRAAWRAGVGIRRPQTARRW